MICFQIKFGVLHQSPKFWFVIKDIVLTVLSDYPGMVPGDWWVIDADLTLVSSTHSDPLWRNVFDQDKGRALDFNFFKNYMLAFWHLNRHELVNFIVFLYHLRILFLADFTKELLKVVVGESLDLAFLDFGLVPSLQTRKVDQGARSWTFARTAKKLLLSWALFHHTVFAFAFLFAIRNLDFPMIIKDIIYEHDFVLDVPFVEFAFAADRRDEILLLSYSEETSFF